MLIPATPMPGARLISAKNATKLDVLGSLGNGTAYETGWSPDSKFLIIRTTFGLEVYNNATWEKIKTLDDSIDNEFAWSPDGRLLATALFYTDEIPAVHLYDGKTLEPMKTFTTGDSFQWSPDGKLLAIIGESIVYFYDANSLKEVKKMNIGKSPCPCQFSPDGKIFATLHNRTARLWEVASGKKVNGFENRGVPE